VRYHEGTRLAVHLKEHTMETRSFGNTGISVTALGIGTLTMSPLQRGLAPSEGARVILAALERGVRFVDTAQMYGSYPHVALALADWGGETITVTTKSTARTSTEMLAAIEQARQEMNLDIIDGFLLHAVRGAEDLQERESAIEALQKAKERGVVRAIGASTHSVNALQVLVDDPRIEILHPIVNQVGFGILDAGLDETMRLLTRAKSLGKGVYAMKAMGGGHLRHRSVEVLHWALTQKQIDAAAVGMTSLDEVEMNVAIAEKRPISDELMQRVSSQSRKLFVNEALCKGCGECVRFCEHEALNIEGGKAHPNPRRCVLCGYCAPHCPHFAIRVI